MGRKTQKNQKKVSSESEEEEEAEVEEIDEDEALLDEPQDEEEDLHRQHQEVLEIIQTQLKEGSDEEKLTWLALYSLKKQEIDLNEKMFEEINLIKDQYDLLKQPIFSDIAAAATGKKVDSTLYKPEGLEVPENIQKLAPSALPDYWLTVFTNSGIIEEEDDLQAFGKLTEFQCELLSASGPHLKLTFKFKQETSIFTNKVLTIQSATKVEENEVNHEIKVKEAIKWKGKKNENSVFYALFNPNSNPNEVCELIGEFYRDFCNSIYFYMRRGDLQIEDLEEDDEEESPAEAKPAKKQKKDLQKPDCKQQ